jgi:hypothetical protein
MRILHKRALAADRRKPRPLKSELGRFVELFQLDFQDLLKTTIVVG